NAGSCWRMKSWDGSSSALPSGATDGDWLLRLWRQPRLASGGNANEVLTFFHYAGNEKNPDWMAIHDPGSILHLAKEGRAKARLSLLEPNPYRSYIQVSLRSGMA